jgi:hypothetical protein
VTATVLLLEYLIDNASGDVPQAFLIEGAEITVT